MDSERVYESKINSKDKLAKSMVRLRGKNQIAVFRRVAERIASRIEL
jgi:hypothetical protein